MIPDRGLFFTDNRKRELFFLHRNFLNRVELYSWFGFSYRLIDFQRCSFLEIKGSIVLDDLARYTYAFIVVDDGAATLLTTTSRGAKAEAEARKRAVAAAVNFILAVLSKRI